MKKTEMQGFCPCCESDDLNYGEHSFNFGYMSFEWECGECGKTGEEMYHLEFIGHSVNEEE